MSTKLFLSFVVFNLIFARQVIANVEVVFSEGAPKDRFSISNVGECNFNELIVNIDLSQSEGKLIFDTTATGAGVEVFQPFEISEGAIELDSVAAVKDGDTAISLKIRNFLAKDRVSFTIDVDDTLPESELGMIRVSGSEIKSGKVSVLVDGSTSSSAKFGVNSNALVTLDTCSS